MNELSREISLSGVKAQYDAQCKRVLGHKVILAWIMKRTIQAFSDMDVETICGCIEGEPTVR